MPPTSAHGADTCIDQTDWLAAGMVRMLKRMRSHPACR
jgi:hypothetical protein